MQYSLVGFLNVVRAYPVFMEPVLEREGKFYIQFRDVVTKRLLSLREITMSFYTDEGYFVSRDDDSVKINPESTYIHALGLSKDNVVWGTMEELLPRLMDIKEQNPQNKYLNSHIDGYINEYNSRKSHATEVNDWNTPLFRS